MRSTRAALTEQAPVRTTLTGAALAVAVLAATAGCTSAEAEAEGATPTVTVTAAPAPAPSASATPAESPEVQLVREYLDAAAAGDAAAAWPLLTPEAQAFYPSEQQFASAFGRDGTVTPEAAGQLVGATFQEAEALEGAVTVVSVTTEAEADAWVVRESSAGLRIDDAGVPSTGDSVYEWTNPAAGAEDVQSDAGAASFDDSAPASISFASPASADATGPSVVGYPTGLFAFVDGVETPVDEPVSAGSGRQFTIPVGSASTDGAPRGLTVVWQVGDAPASFRSSTVLL
ncbi:hypothetical protein ES689_13430 [Frigoribacterium sp. ACAM 257]|uniref:hypothetical protein n=1 Tax=Frigoribacterium sp. ACAM 257 TaxID=2508998 RepID=UPI0011BA1165|nr:hypothetical protein [Frigoribacterium sp. ACAM 257]TWX35577.1 hypothetical protein ES689_13430 [Frigoribacterium sp. ACAM 257]